MKRIRKVLSLLLVCCMIAGMSLNVSAENSTSAKETAIDDVDNVQIQSEVQEGETLNEGTGNEAKTLARDTSGDAFYKIVHLDAGRKYFTKEWIIALLHEMQADGYNYLELAFGNDGLRFLLDDMSVTVNGTTYSSAQVTSGIQAGNKAYYNAGAKNELSQSEMDEIIAAANECGIQIIPLLNTPGHMDAIVSAMKSLGISNPAYNGSARTVDITNETAVAFTQALVKKYIDYFKGKGSTIFNIGTDEYANDIYTDGSMGFGQLQNNGQYDEFVVYVNQLAELVIEAGMTPMAFNDGIYFNNVDNQGTFNEDILISYWSSGWNGYSPASASFLANKGHRLVNTHGDYYYVLGKNDAFTPGNSTAHDANQYTAASGFNNNTFAGNSTVSAAGSMFCIWCDYPEAETETEIAKNARLALRAMAKRMDGESIDNMDTSAVLYGFNEDGTIYAEPKDPGDPEDPVTEGKPVTITVNGTDTRNQNGLEKALTEGNIAIEDNSIVDVTIEAKENSTSAGTRITRGTEVTNIESGADYVIASGNNTLITSGTNLSKGSLPAEGGEIDSTGVWTITKSGSGYTISQEIEGKTYYLGYDETKSNGLRYTEYTYQLNCSTTSSVWTYENGKFYRNLITKKDNWFSRDTYNNYYLSYNNGWSMSTTDASVSLYEVNEEVIPGTTTYDHTITFTGKKVGKTTVTVGNVTYAVTVLAEDIGNASPLTVDFWITNRAVDADGIEEKTETDGTTITRRYYEYSVTSKEGIYSESGIKFSDLVPATGTQDSKDTTFWKGTCLASDNWQTSDSGSDKTLQGNDFTYIRYWGGNWSYSTDGKTWTNVKTGDQIVAYYLQKTEITQEITTNVVDWGQDYAEWKEGIENRWFWDGYVQNGSKYVFLDFAVVYEDGTQNPDSFPVDNTWFYHFDGCSATNPRVLGAISFTENDEYEIWKVTVQDGTSTGYSSCDTFNPTYSGDETIVWTEDMGGEPSIESLTYTANRSGKLVRVYVRAKVTEDSLTVHYIDKTAGNTEFYNYNIAVKQGTTFDSGFGLGQEKNTLINNTVVNIKAVTQTVTADLSTMSEIGAQYRYSEYSCDEVKRSDDGKQVYLYYTFNNTHSFVIDFGLPLNITTSDIGIAGDWTNATVTGAKYGTAEVTLGEGIIYTPTKVLQGVETLQLTLQGANGSTTHQIYIYPATTVYYEEGFAVTDKFSGGSKGTGNQETAKFGDTLKDSNPANNYGYDEVYDAGAEKRTESVSRVIGDGATFTFTGTGVDIYANCTENTGMVLVQITNSQGRLKKMMTVDTALKLGEIDTNNGLQAIGTTYNVPIVSVAADTLDHDTYTVTLTHVKRSDMDVKDIKIDGFKVYGTMAEADSDYNQDNEANPKYAELRNAVLTSLNATSNDSVKYANQIAKNVMSQVYATNEDADGAVIISAESAGYTEENLQDFIDNCSKNELYLYPGQSLVFKPRQVNNMQIGLKALNGAVTYSVNNGESIDLSSNADMFYPISVNNNGSVTITNNSDVNDKTKVLSITKLKNMATEQIALMSLNEADIMPALMSLGFRAEPNNADATANINLVDYTGKILASTSLTANGEEGTEATFAAADIQTLAEQLMPEGYAFVDVSAITDQTVVCGESADINVQIGKVATLNVTYKTLFGKTAGTAILTAVQTSSASSYTFSASEIREAAPSGFWTGTLISTKVKYGSTGSRTVIGF